MYNKNIKVLEIGPSITRSKGGMATVIAGIKEDTDSFKEYKIDLFESFIDGNKLIRIIFSIYAYMRFLFYYKRYDIFHIHMASYGSTLRKIRYIKFLKKKNKKIVVHIHGASYIEFYESLNIKKRMEITKTLNSVDKVIALSDTWKKFFDEKVKLTNVSVLNNGINVERYIECRNILENKSDILFLGRLGKRKGTYDLISAIRILKDRGIKVNCIMAGDGEVERAKAFATDLEVNSQINFTGWINSNRKIELLKKVGIVVLPSYNEGLPMTILEGMASGKAIISTKVGAIPEVISENKNGILINPGDIDSLAKAIEYLIKNVNTINLMSKNNIIKIEDTFNQKKIHLKLRKYFSEIYY